MNPRMFEVGERVWSIRSGWTEVTSIESESPYPIRTKSGFYTPSGRYEQIERYRSLYHADEIVDGVLRIQVEPKKRKLWVFAYASKEEAIKARQRSPYPVGEIKEIEFEV